MRWIDQVRCWTCNNGEYRVVGGVWTCTCGSPLTLAEIREYHYKLELEIKAHGSG